MLWLLVGIAVACLQQIVLVCYRNSPWAHKFQIYVEILKCILRVPSQNGLSQAWYIAEIHHSGRKPIWGSQAAVGSFDIKIWFLQFTKSSSLSWSSLTIGEQPFRWLEWPTDQRPQADSFSYTKIGIVWDELYLRLWVEEDWGLCGIATWNFKEDLWLRQLPCMVCITCVMAWL